MPVSPLTAVLSLPGMNAAVRAVVRMGIYTGAKVYFIYEVSVPRQPCFLWPPGVCASHSPRALTPAGVGLC